MKEVAAQKVDKGTNFLIQQILLLTKKIAAFFFSYDVHMFMHMWMTQPCFQLKNYTGSQGQSHKQVVSGIGYVRKAGYVGDISFFHAQGDIERKWKGKESETTKLKRCYHTGGICVQQRILTTVGWKDIFISSSQGIKA